MLKYFKAVILRNSARFVQEFAEFMQENQDYNQSHYEIAIRLEGLNIEYLPSRKPGERQGKNLTVTWL